MNSNLKKVLFGLNLMMISVCSLQAADCPAKGSECGLKATEVKANLKDYFKDFPYLGLIADEITYGPVTVSQVHINHHKKYAVVDAGETIQGSLFYKVDSDKADFGRYHLIIGIEGVGAQDCIAHTFNLWDSKGKGKFTLHAPTKKGVYTVRFMFHDGITCTKAQDAWNKGEDPSSAATIGVIIVK